MYTCVLTSNVDITRLDITDKSVLVPFREDFQKDSSEAFNLRSIRWTMDGEERAYHARVSRTSRKMRDATLADKTGNDSLPLWCG